MESWLKEIVESIKEQDTPSIIAICGAADLGKSYISKGIVNELIAQRIDAVHLTLDSYLLDRSERLNQRISGYRIDAYEQQRALEALSQFKEQFPIVFFPYNHETGKKTTNPEILEPASILIFDGVQSMHECFDSHTDLSVFIYTEDNILKRIRFDADLTKRKHSVEFANSNSEPEFIEYKTQIEPYIFRADHKLFMERKWQYRNHT